MTFVSKYLSTTARLALPLAACVAGAAASSSALAQEANALPTVEVTSPTRVPTPIGQIASSVTVITAADIERDQRRTVVDALQAVPGLNVVQNGGPGGVTAIFIRGTNSNHTKVLLDGIDVSDPSSPNGAADLGNMLTGDIEQIEVLRGPQSGLYGSDAIGGVISITTKAGKGPATVRARVEGGSFGTINSSGGVSGSQGPVSYNFNVEQLHTSGAQVTPLELLPPGQQRFPNPYDNKTFSTKVGVDVSENLALNFTGRYTEALLGFTGFGPFMPAFPFGEPADKQSTTASTQLFTRSEAVVTGFDGRLKNYFGANFTELRRNNFDPYGQDFTTFLPAPFSTNNGERNKYDWRSVATFLPGQTLVTGADYEIERFNSNTVQTKENGNRGAYVELQSQFADRFFVVSNIRVDDNDAFGDHTTYRIAPAFIVPGTETKLKATYGTGFKAPTLSQLYDTSFGLDNPNLKPEESRGYDVGFEQPIANDRVRFGTTYFNNDITNLINTAGTFPAQKYFNVQAAKTSGFETFAAITFNERFKIRFDHTYTDAVDTQTGLELTRRPRNKMSYTAIWTPIDDLTLSATAISFSSFLDVPRFGAVNVVTPGYTIVNLAANYKVAEGVTAFARIDNLLNEQYVNPDGFLRPGFGVFGGVRFASAPVFH
ncbi:TonB-dependent receptor plug domain-containing protein [Bradyrhizobium sp. SYSU BS000235]|uniref:TonB-dependent receptor plug domain-containing protein n=1 Tax=Bradyrhizobium sp. SYSU BS000235 TaxID=3411332 RepID=UPI003C72DDE8